MFGETSLSFQPQLKNFHWISAWILILLTTQISMCIPYTNNHHPWGFPAESPRFFPLGTCSFLGYTELIPWSRSSFTSNSLQLFSLEFKFWLSHQNHSLGNLTGCFEIRLSGTMPSIYNYICIILIRILGSFAQPMNISLIIWLWFWWEGQKLNSSENILKELDVKWDPLHGMSSSYPQTAGNRDLFMPNCEGKCCRILLVERGGKIIWWEQWNGVLTLCGGWALLLILWWFLVKSPPGE